MPSVKNKVKYGLKNVYYAIATMAADGSATYGTPVRWPGAVNLTLDQQSERTTFRADNVDYWVGNSNSAYEGDFESAIVPDEFKTDVLGYRKDADGVLYEPAKPADVHFALLFQFDGDAKNLRRAMYNCVATPPGETGQTTGEQVEPQTETLSIRASSVYIPSLDIDLVKASTNPDTDSTVYDDWFDAVKVPTAFV